MILTIKNKTPTWSDVKAKLADFDRAGLIGLVQGLYAASKDNQLFLHSRFGLGGNVLEPYKAVIDRWLWPDPFKKQNTSVARAKKALTDYKRAVGRPEGADELRVFFCERAAGFSKAYGLDDESYFDALLNMFAQALQAIAAFPDAQRLKLLRRLVDVRHLGFDIGYGVSDDMDQLLAEHGYADGSP